MDYILLKKTYFELLERIDMYFDNELMQEPSAKADCENHKNDLLQDLAIEVWANYNREAYTMYEPETFIWLKAKKVWITFVRRLKREKSRKSNESLDGLHDTYIANNFLKQFETQDALEVIRKILNQSEFELLQCRAQGLTYKEIAKLKNYPSEDAAKMRFNRIKNAIRNHIRRS
jgi:DNA-directed RNA polymerase specialized sigma24 family protein